jgi:S-adenosylmethionine hydrolase
VIVALLTDFGLRDHYVGAMKGVILSVCPEATLVDITHDIPPQDIRAGALELAAASPYFPGGTVFLTVVDPGVGSGRRGVAADAEGYRFVGPDNGVLSLALGDHAVRNVVELRERKFARPHVSRTFEGRDRFAPAAGWLARGIDLAALGPAVHDLVMLDLPRPVVVGGELVGEVLRVDRFGNLITNIDQPTLDALHRAQLLFQIGDHQIAGLVHTYAEAEPGAVCALVGSGGHLEIAVNGGSASGTLQVSRGARIRVREADT